jgi:hypothetical protein
MRWFWRAGCVSVRVCCAARGTPLPSREGLGDGRCATGDERDSPAAHAWRAGCASFPLVRSAAGVFLMAGNELALGNAARDVSPTTVSNTGVSPIPVHVSHALEDVLLGVLIVALALDDRIPPRMLRDVLRVFLRARHDGRSSDLLASARDEARSLPQWQCTWCRETNPGTFELCWQCRQPRPYGLPRLCARSEIILAVDSATTLKSGRAAETGDSP